MSVLKVIKLVSGEEVLGVISEYSTDNLLHISGPLKITTEYNKATKTHSLYLSDWIPALNDDSFPIDKKNIITMGNPTRELEDHYLELALLSNLDIDADDDFSDDDLQ